MGKFRFTAEMFYKKGVVSWDEMAEEANAALDEHLKTLKMVYRQPGFSGHSWQESLHDASNRTHAAFLFDVEEIKPKKCPHSTIHFNQPETDVGICQTCGTQLLRVWQEKK